MENNTVEKLSQEAEKQIIQLLEVTGHPNILSAINYFKTLQAGIKEDREVWDEVSIEEKPEKTGWYYVLNPNGEIFPNMIYYSKPMDMWYNDARINFIRWLKKTKLSELIWGASDKNQSV